MHKVEAIAKLERRAKAIKALGATSLYLFGSVVRNEAKAASDLDLFIDYDRDSRFNAFHLVRIKQYLEGELGLDVDVTTRDGLHPMLRSEIEQSAVRVSDGAQGPDRPVAGEPSGCGQSIANRRTVLGRKRVI